MKTKFFSSIRWKFIFLIIASGILTLVTVLVLFQAAVIFASTEPLGSIIREVGNSIFAPVLVILACCMVFIIYYFALSQKSIRYLEEITIALQQIARGRFDTRIPKRTADELGELAENINSMAYQVKDSIEEERRSEKTKNELVTSISHDLRTPLTSILGYLDLIVNDRYKDEVELRYYADIAFGKAQRLKKLIDDLFEFTKISNEGIRLNLVRVNLGELLEQLAEEFVPILDEADMEYRLSVPEEKVIVMADGDMIVRVFENLISNAVRYGQDGRYIDIELLKADGEAAVRISNYGEVIPETELPHIFERFYRVDKSRSEKTGGTGLGLAIAKNIVELHNGKILAYCRQEKTVFETRLKLVNPSSP